MEKKDKKTYSDFYKPLPSYKKIIFIISHIYFVTLILWIIMLIYNESKQEDKFFNYHSAKVVYYFGMVCIIITIVFWIFVLIFNALGIPLI